MRPSAEKVLELMRHAMFHLEKDGEVSHTAWRKLKQVEREIRAIRLVVNGNKQGGEQR